MSSNLNSIDNNSEHYEIKEEYFSVSNYRVISSSHEEGKRFNTMIHIQKKYQSMKKEDNDKIPLTVEQVPLNYQDIYEISDVSNFYLDDE